MRRWYSPRFPLGEDSDTRDAPKCFAVKRMHQPAIKDREKATSLKAQRSLTGCFFRSVCESMVVVMGGESYQRALPHGFSLGSESESPGPQDPAHSANLTCFAVVGFKVTI